MAIADRPIVRRLLSEAESLLGVSVQPADRVARWSVMEQEFGAFVDNAEELAFQTMDYAYGRPHEMRRDTRRRLSQRSRIALLQDPLAGAEAELLANFGFGKGVSKPSARNPKVQDVIDAAWTDPINEQVLCGYMAQRKMSNNLLTSAELFTTLYVGGGKVRVGGRSPDRIIDIIPDPENEQVPLYYVEERPIQRWEWDPAMDQWKAVTSTDAGRPKCRYWPHWRNLEDAQRERAQFDVDDQELKLPEIPAEKLAKGVIYHTAINQVGEGLRGNPPWARTLRFMNAMNVLTEAHVSMAQAASSIIARRSMTGSDRQITKAAESVMSAASEIGASAFRNPGGWGVAGNAEPTTQPFTAPGQPGPFPPGSWWNDNQSSKLEPLSLQSGSGQMAQTAQIVRAPIAANSSFGQHYLGDASDANLATASTLELPATMRVGAWQESFEQLYRWFTDRAIEAAVKAGVLGGMDGFDGAKPLSEMRLQEAEDRAAMEARTDKDLSYEFTMPFPGRRQLADVTTFVQTLAATMDPNGVNVPYRRILLRFAFEQIGIDDVSRAVEDSIPEKGLAGGIGPQSATGNAAGSFAPAPPGGAGGKPGAGATGSGAGAGANDPAEAGQPYGAKAGTAAGGGSSGDGALEADLEAILALEAEWLPDDARVSTDRMKSATSQLFRQIVGDPAMAEVAGMNGR